MSQPYVLYTELVYPHQRHWILRYGFALIAVLAAVAVRIAAGQFLGKSHIFLFLWPVVFVSAWYGGFGPGVFATALSALMAAFFLFEPRYSFLLKDPSDLFGTAVFILLGGSISALVESLHRSHTRGAEAMEQVSIQREWLDVTLRSIGDGVIATDALGLIRFMNAVAESLTSWESDQAQGKPIEEVFRIIDRHTRVPVENPVEQVLIRRIKVSLSEHTILVPRRGEEVQISGSAAPIRNRAGKIFGVVLVFVDVSRRTPGPTSSSGNKSAPAS